MAVAKNNFVFTLLLEGKKRDWKKGNVSNIFEGAENRIKNVGYFKFNNFNTFEYMDTQLFTVNKIEDFDYLNHSNQIFINSDKTK
jgi:hypothetical protein